MRGIIKIRHINHCPTLTAYDSLFEGKKCFRGKRLLDEKSVSKIKAMSELAYGVES